MLAELLTIIGREPAEHCTILSQAPGEAGLCVDWTTVGDAEKVAEQYAGSRSVWFGVQPLRATEGGRGKRSDVTGLRTLYADLDDKNMTRAVAMEIIGDLSEILGAEPSAIVVSGGGLQPYWPLVEVDPITGAGVLLWWREMVIAAAAARGVAVDTGVYDLARILRVPGPPNLKACYGPGGAKTGMVINELGWIPNETLAARMALYPAEAKTRSTFTRSESALIGARGPSSQDRVFTPEQWAAYVRRPGGELETMGSTELGAGFNTALNKAAFACGAGVPELWSEAEAIEAILEYLERQFPGGPDAQDWSTIKSGFSQTSWSARRPTETEATDPFRAFANPVAIWEKQGRKVKPTKVKSPAERVLDDAGAIIDHGEDGAFLSEEFWAARPVFAHLRKAAWSAMESPEGVFVAALGLVLAHTMPNIVLPAYVGVEASLNLMTVICGDPGDGKSVCRKLAAQVISFDTSGTLWEFNPGSGQGVAGQYQVFRKGTKTEPSKMVRTRYRALAVVEESDTFASLAQNPTSTLSSELRKAAMGESLGFGNIGETQTNIPEHEYRFVLMMCLQPELGQWLLGDAAGGLPQRFLWCSVRDPRVVEGVERPGVWPVKIPSELTIDPISEVPRARKIMEGTPAIRDEIREAKKIRKIEGRAAGADFDGHAMLTRLKVAGALGILDGRLNITDEDWALAGAVMTMSNSARAGVQEAVTAAAARHNERAGKARGRSRVIEEGVVIDTVKSRCRDRVLKILGEQPGILRRALHARLSGPQKEVFSEVLDELLAGGWIRFEDRPQSSAWYLK